MKILRQVFLLVIMTAIGAGAAYAYFSAQAKVQGASFSTGTAVLKIANTGTPATWDNDTLTGNIFTGIIPGWTNNYHVFVKNTGSTALELIMSGNMTDGTDACGLSNDIKLALGVFNDSLTNLNTLVGGIDLGIINPNEVKDVTLAFSMPSTTLTGGTTCTLTSYNFIFDGTALPTIQPTPTPTP